jgi:hypothetical protein
VSRPNRSYTRRTRSSLPRLLDGIRGPTWRSGSRSWSDPLLSRAISARIVLRPAAIEPDRVHHFGSSVRPEATAKDACRRCRLRASDIGGVVTEAPRRAN